MVPTKCESCGYMLSDRGYEGMTVYRCTDPGCGWFQISVWQSRSGFRLATPDNRSFDFGYEQRAVFNRMS